MTTTSIETNGMQCGSMEIKSAVVRVLIVDEHPVFRHGLASLLGQTDDMQVVAEASNTAEAIIQAQRSQPDVVIMDIYMQGGDGFEGTATLHERVPNAKILIFTKANSKDDLCKVVKAGAHGFLLKTAGVQEVIDSVRKVAAGETALSAAMTTKLMEEYRSFVKKNDIQDFRILSPREREILQLASKGDTNKVIAYKCFISETTVKAHFRNILEKLDAKNRAGAVAIASAKGLLKEREA